MKAATSIAIVAIACLRAAGQGKLDEEQARIIEGARTAALNYSAELPDFLCTEEIRRQVDPRGDNRWRQVDRLTVRLSYFGHVEDYKLIAVDGKSTVLDYLNVGGALTTGEFGSRLVSIFVPKSKAVFEWK